MTNSATHQENRNIGELLNIIGVFGICISLSIAFYYQIAKSELPCPLCLLQRVGMIMIGCGFLFNLFLGVRGTHYAIALVGSVVTGLISARQVFLHILPGDAGYGSPLMGVHFYSWALISSISSIIAIAMMLTASEKSWKIKLSIGAFWKKLVGGLFALLVFGNIISTILECGIGPCADDPTEYQLLKNQ